MRTPPTLTKSYPTCDGCDLEVESDGDGWLCPRCRVHWDYETREDEPGNWLDEDESEEGSDG